MVPCLGRRPHPGTIEFAGSTFPEVVLSSPGFLPHLHWVAHTFGIMPCLRTATIHGVVCKFYDGGVVKVGTSAASRFTIKVPKDEESWFPTRLREELVKRELATAGDLLADETGEAAMAAKAAASAEEASRRAAWKKAVADEAAEPRRQAAAALESAEHAKRIASKKRELAEKNLELAEDMAAFKRAAPNARAQMEAAAPLLADLAAKVAPESRAKLEAATAQLEVAQSSQRKLEAFWGKVEVRIAPIYATTYCHTSYLIRAPLHAGQCVLLISCALSS